MLGGRDGVSAGCVHHDDATLGGGLDVHVVHSHAGPSDGLEVFRCGDDTGIHLGLTADDEGGVIGDDLEQFVVRQAGTEGHFQLASFGEGFHAALGNGIRDKNFWFRH